MLIKNPQLNQDCLGNHFISPPPPPRKLSFIVSQLSIVRSEYVRTLSDITDVLNLSNSESPNQLPVVSQLNLQSGLSCFFFTFLCRLRIILFWRLLYFLLNLLLLGVHDFQLNAWIVCQYNITLVSNRPSFVPNISNKLYKNFIASTWKKNKNV